MSVVWPWIDMSSLPPNAPPLLTSSVCTRTAVDAQHACALPLIVEHALALRVDEHPPFAVRRGFQRIAGRRMAVVLPRFAQLVERQRGIIDRNRDARLRLKKQMLDALRAIRIFDDVGRFGEACFDVAALQLRFAEQVRAALRMDQRRTRLQCCLRRCDRLQHFVFDVDQLGRLAGQSLRIGDNAGDDVAAAASFFADRDEDRPIFFDQPDVAIARHIGGRDHAMDAFELQRAARIDAATPSPADDRSAARHRTACSARPCRR